MFKRKPAVTFGLRQARQVAVIADVHIPTLRGTLTALDVPNVVGADAAREIGKTSQTIQQAKDKISVTRSKDGQDERETRVNIETIQTARSNRARINATDIQKLERAVESAQATVAELKALGQKFAW